MLDVMHVQRVCSGGIRTGNSLAWQKQEDEANHSEGFLMPKVGIPCGSRILHSVVDTLVIRNTCSR